MILTRRQMLRSLSGLAVAPMFLRTMAAEAASANDTILVAVMLAGGNDGLNTVIPLQQYGSYYTLRTPAKPPNAATALAYSEAALAATAFNANPATAAANATQFAFNPSMAPMRKLYATGHLAVVAGVGLPLAEQGSLNHGTAQIDWQTGQINADTSSYAGWLGRTLDGAAAGSLGPTTSFSGTSLLLSGATNQPLTISSPLDNFGMDYSTTANWNALISAQAQIMALKEASTAGAYDQGVLNGAAAAVTTVQAIGKQEPVSDYPAPTTYLDYQMRDVARMILAGSGVRGFFTEHGSYDSHSAQQTIQPALLADLSTALYNFYTYLKAKGASSNVVVMTLSDFGRRPGANLDFGTDHGAATVSFVLGDKVKGGVFGDYPSLTNLDVNGNLAVGLDFRNLLSDMIVSMGGNAGSILGETWPTIGFI